MVNSQDFAVVFVILTGKLPVLLDFSFTARNEKDRYATLREFHRFKGG